MDADELRATLMRELESPEVLELSADFYERCREYIKKLKAEAEKDPDKREIIEFQLGAVENTIRMIFIVRIIKLLKYYSRYGRKPSISIPEEESKAFNVIISIVELITSGKTEVKVVGEKSEPEPIHQHSEGVLVEFVKPHTKVLISTGASVGPFDKGDVAFLPKSIAMDLAKRGFVDILEE